jgi:gamma-glutamyltranspeptidase / glutathione hydrolase
LRIGNGLTCFFHLTLVSGCATGPVLVYSRAMSVRGVIAAGDPATAEAGARLLAEGGNAVDAAVGAAFASFVCEAPLTSPAGGGMMLYGSPSLGFHALDCFATTPGLGAPSAADQDFHEVIVHFGPTSQSFHIGRASAAVPGALLGLLQVHAEAGTLPLAEVVRPAIALARGGYQVSVPAAGIAELLAPILTMTAGSRSVFCGPGGELPAPGDTLSNPGMAVLLEGVARDGLSFVRGPFAEALCEQFGPRAGGRITAADLTGFAPVRRPPLSVPYLGSQVLLTPPPASGGGLVGLGLRLAERAALHTLVDDRARAIATARLLTTVSAARTGGYDERVHDRSWVESVFLSDDNVGRFAEVIAQEERALGSTTHVSVLDHAGCACSITMSNGEGSGHVVEPFGVHVNNFLGEEDINPHGFHVLPPASRMTTMMSPTVVLRDGHPTWVMGTGGSNRIRSAVTIGLLHALAWRLAPDAVSNGPRMHVEGSKLWFEAPERSLGANEALMEAATEVSRFDELHMFFGGLHIAGRADELFGAGDRRRGGVVRLV